MFRTQLGEEKMRHRAINKAINPDRCSPNDEPTCTGWPSDTIRCTHVDTEVAAQMLLVDPKTLHKSHSKHGEYGGIRPVRLPSRKLAWPLDEIKQLLNGGAK